MKRNSILQLMMLPVICLVIINSCKYDEVLPFEPDPGIIISFNEDIIPIFETKCTSAGCHNGSGQSPDLRSSVAYDNLVTGGYVNIEVPEQSLLYLWMSEVNGPMPPLGANATDNALVLQWIEQGAINK